ncbi:MAG: oligosaccharide flippase family protein [Longimicrobiaceae bacterium]
MKAALRATTVLASGSAVTVVVGIVSAKAWALLVGPPGMGRLALLQGMVGLGGIVAGVGLNSALVQMGASARGRGDEATVAASRVAAQRLTLALAACAAVLAVVFRVPLARWLLAGEQHAGAAALMGLAVGFTLLANTQTGVLNAHHRVGALARTAVLTSALGGALSVAVLWIWRERGIAWAVVGPALVGWLVATWIARREVGPAGHAPPAAVRRATRGLFAFGVPHMAGSLVGSGVQFALPMLVLAQLGADGVGFFRAAWTLAIGYLGFLVTAMGQDYYPRASAAGPGELEALVNQQLRLVTLLGGAVIVVAQVATPYVLPLLYAPSFAPAAEILGWQWLGSLVKLWGWALGLVVLARLGSRTYFVGELVGGASLLAGSVLGMRWLGLEGLGAGFLLTQLLYAAVVWALVRRGTGIALAPRTWGLMAGAFGVLAGLRLISGLGLGAAGLAVMLLLGAAAVACHGWILWREFKHPDVVLSS